MTVTPSYQKVHEKKFITQKTYNENLFLTFFTVENY